MAAADLQETICPIELNAGKRRLNLDGLRAMRPCVLLSEPQEGRADPRLAAVPLTYTDTPS